MRWPWHSGQDDVIGQPLVGRHITDSSEEPEAELPPHAVTSTVRVPVGRGPQPDRSRWRPSWDCFRIVGGQTNTREPWRLPRRVPLAPQRSAPATPAE